MTRTASLVLAALLAAALPAADKPDRDAGAKKAITDAIAVLEARLEKETEPTAKRRLEHAVRGLEHMREVEILTPGEKLAAFAAAPGKCRGETLTLPLTYVGAAPLADRVGQDKVEFEGTPPGAKTPVRVLLDLPKDAYVSVTGDGRGVVLSVSFKCRQGKLDAGNVAGMIVQK